MQSLTVSLEEKIKNYRQCLSVIKEFLDKSTVSELEDALARLDSLTLNIAVFGETNSGKSALLNSLLGLDNSNPAECLFKVDEKANCWSDDIQVSNGKEWTHRGDITLKLFDTPGIAGDIGSHVNIALDIAEKSDIIIYVVWDTVKNPLQVPVMKRILASSKPLVVAINKADTRRDEEIIAVRQDLIGKFQIQEGDIVECSGYPIKGRPDIGKLVIRLLELVDLHQARLIDATIQKKIDVNYNKAKEILVQRAEVKAHEIENDKRAQISRYKREKQERLVINQWIVHGCASTAGVTGTVLAQVPGGNEAALTTITVAMICMLCSNYDKLSKSQLFSYMGVLTGGMVGKAIVSYAWRIFPGVGNIIEGLATFAIHESQGWLIAAMLENGIYDQHQLSASELERLRSQAKEMQKEASAIEEQMNPDTIMRLKAKYVAIKQQGNTTAAGLAPSRS